MDEIPAAAPVIHAAATVADAGRLAGRHAADAIRAAIAEHGSARVIFASAPSQDAMLAQLGQEPGIDWTLVRSFHMDEYLDLAPTHPRSFGLWLQERLPQAALAGLERMRPDSAPAAEAERYKAMLAEGPIDVVCLGIGVNGHIAFNEPGEADPRDPELIRVVTLDDASRQQQVHEGLFPTLADVPTRALTLTVPALLAGGTLVCSVIGSHKAPAVARAVHGPIDTSVPASFLRTHPDVTWFLDADAAEELDREAVGPNSTLQL